MEIIIGAIITLLTEIIKVLIKKTGKEMGKAITILVVFLLAAIYSFLSVKGYFSTELIKEILAIGSYAIAVYEVLYKRIILPVFNKI